MTISTQAAVIAKLWLFSCTTGTATTGAGAGIYANDADGNTLSGSGRANIWDSQNRLVSCTVNGVTSAYTYGADGLRRSSTVNGVTTYYVYDGQTMVQEAQKNAQGQLQATTTYLCGPRGPECRIDEVHQDEGYYQSGYYTDLPFGSDCKAYDSKWVNPNLNSATYQYLPPGVRGRTTWYVFDGLGSVVGEVDPNGSMTASAKYDVYGAKRTGGTGTASSRQGFVGALGHVTDTETGLVYMRARYYDPNVGRFVSEDPGRHGSNWFVYATDNPTDRVDSDGRSSGWLDLILKTLWNQFGPQGVDLPDSPTEQIDNLIQASKNRMNAGRAAAVGGVGEAVEGDATENDTESAEGNIEAGSGLAQEAVASFTFEQSEEIQQFIVDMGDIIGP